MKLCLLLLWRCSTPTSLSSRCHYGRPRNPDLSMTTTLATSPSYGNAANASCSSGGNNQMFEAVISKYVHPHCHCHLQPTDGQHHQRPDPEPGAYSIFLPVGQLPGQLLEGPVLKWSQIEVSTNPFSTNKWRTGPDTLDDYVRLICAQKYGRLLDMWMWVKFVSDRIYWNPYFVASCFLCRLIERRLTAQRVDARSWQHWSDADPVLTPLQWCHNELDDTSNHRRHDVMFTQPFVRAQTKENIKAPRHWPLCWEFTGDRWIPRTEGQ